MSHLINIGPGTDIDLEDLIQSRLLIQGNSGAGKSGVARIIIEETFGKIPFVVWDIEGEYYTLKELSADIVIIGGQHADVPITMELAEKLPAFIIKNRLNVVVDLSDLKMHSRIEFTKDFFETLMDLPMEYWTPYFFFLEECHKLAGEQDKQESATAIKDLMQRGRKRKFCGIPLTQRISMLNKSVAAECNNKFIGRTNLDLDMDRSAKELGFSKAADRLKLRDLVKKHFYAYGTSIQPQHVHEITIKNAKTTMPSGGMHINFKPGKPTKALLDMLSALSKEENVEETPPLQDANEVAAVRIENRNLKEEVEVIRDQLSQTKEYIFDLQNEIVLLKEYKDKAGKEMQQFADVLREKADELHNFDTLLSMSIDQNLEKISKSEKPKSHVPPIPDLQQPKRYRQSAGAIVSGNANHVRNISKIKWDDSQSNGVLPIGQRNILTACADYPNGLNRKALTTITGYTRRTRDAYIFALRNKEYLEIAGDKLKPTSKGRKALGLDYKPLPKGRALRDYWLNNLPAGERTILMWILNAGTNQKSLPVTRDYISQKTNYTRRTRDAYIYNMLAKEIIKVAGKGQVQVSELLYD